MNERQREIKTDYQKRFERLQKNAILTVQERDTAREERDALRAELAAVKAERDALRVALENARHALVTLNGLGAFDRNASPYQDALREGLDADDAHDCFMEDTWTLDESNVIAEIDAALAAKG